MIASPNGAASCQCCAGCCGCAGCSRGGRGRGRRWWPQCSRPSARKTALRQYHGHRSQQRGHHLADRARRNTGQHPQSPRTERSERSAHRPAWYFRRPGNQDPGDRGRTRCLHHAVRPARRHAARLRQGDWQGNGRRLHAGRADRHAHDVYAERQAVRRCRYRWPRFSG